MSKHPRCEVADCNEPKFYVNGSHCLGHIRTPPKPIKSAAPAAPKSATVPTVDESESSD